MMKIFTLLLTLLPIIGFSQIASWDFSGETNLPTSTAEVYNANLDASNVLTRGAGAPESAGANSFRTVGFMNDGINVANTDYFQNTFSAAAGYQLSLTSIDANFAGTATFSATPGVSMQYAYSLNGTTFTLIGSPFSQIGNGSMPTISLSGIPALQNVADNITVTIRLYASGQTGTGGWGYSSAATPGTIGLAFGGTVTSVSAGCSITAAGLTALTCNNNGTGTIPSDDYLTFNFNPTGSNLGATYTVSVPTGTITPTTGSYGVATSFQLQNGSAGAGNVTVTITDNTTGGCTFDRLITDPGVCSSAVPVITLNPASLTGFNHVVGTPSAEQTFTASALSLTADLVLTAPTNFQISLTSGAGFTNSISLTPTTGTVNSTTIYTRANALTMGALNAPILGTSAGAENDTVLVSGYADDYVYYTIDQISTTDANGVADSLDVLVELTGAMYCIDFDGNAGYSFTIIDGSQSGINVFNFADRPNYTNPLEGDSLRIFGKIGQFNGLLQVVTDSIQLLAQGVNLISPVVVTTLNESTESQYIKMMNLTFVTPITNFPAGSNNINVTDGVSTFTLRIDSDTDIPGAAAPQGAFHVTGTGGQFDSSSPYTSGYQIFPCGLSSFEPACTTPSNAVTTSGASTATATATGVTYQWINCSGNTVIGGATSQSFIATNTGSYAVIVSSGSCADTSNCVSLVGTAAGIEENTLLNAVSVYPNPVQDMLTVKNSSNEAVTFIIVDMNGKEVSTSTSVLNTTNISTSTWNKGVYFVKFASKVGEAVLRVVK